MEAIRQVIDSNLLDNLKLPRHMRNRKVEIIVMPVDEVAIEEKKPIENLIGILHEYSNPDFMHLEKGAWARAMEDKHASS